MKKICPFHKDDIESRVRWLNDQADRGLELYSWGFFFVKFKESEGKRYWYQMDIDDWEDGPNEERRKELESQGWEYKDTIPGTSYHIYRCTEEKKPFQRDSEFCRCFCKKRETGKWTNRIILLLAVAVYLYLLYSQRDILLLEISKGDLGQMHIYMAIFVCMILVLFRDLFYQRRLCRTLLREISSGVVPAAEKTEREQMNLNFLVTMITWVIYGCLILWVIVTWNNTTTYNLTEKSGEITYLELSEFLGDSVVFSEEYLESEPEVNQMRSVTFYQGMLAEQVYEVHQFGRMKDGEPENLTGCYWNQVTEKASEPLFAQIVNFYTSDADQWSMEELENSYFTELITAKGIERNRGVRCVFARKDQNIVYLWYRGNVPTETLIEGLENLR